MPITPFHVWIITYALSCAFFFTTPWLRGPVIGIALLHLVVFLWGIVNIRSQFFGKVFYCTATESKKTALTFDDGPDPNLTVDILDLLKRYEAKATFFVIGKRAEQYPDLVKQTFDAGHCIACHDLTHAYGANFRMTKALMRDIAAAQLITQRIIGVRPLLYRPPVGLMNPHVPLALMRLRMTCIGWNRRVGDAGNRRRKTLYDIPKLAKPGSVVLLHDCLPKPENKTVFLEQLELLLKALRKRGLKPVGVDELLDIRAYG